jgi:hypothetical protein
MSFNLPDNVMLPTSPERHNIAIAEIVIFAAILPVQLVVRYIQIRSHAGAKGAKNPLRCLLRAWLNFVIIFAQSMYQKSFKDSQGRIEVDRLKQFESSGSRFISA